MWGHLDHLDNVESDDRGFESIRSTPDIDDMRFTKMHGLGNDYVYIDCVNGPPVADPAAVSRRLSDRHFGIGSDGLILIGPSEVGAWTSRSGRPSATTT